jgi:hypothetical protein
MKKIKHFTVRFLIAMVLIAIFIVQGSIWSSDRSHALQLETLVNAADNQLAQQKKTKSTLKKTDYELIIKDIVDIFRSIESTGTGTAIVSKINGSQTECSRARCEVKLTNSPGSTFSGLKSKKYISSIEISTYFEKPTVESVISTNTNMVNHEMIDYIIISLKDSHEEIFSPNSFNVIMSGMEPVKPVTLREIECNSFSPPCNILKGTYVSEIQEKYFPESYRNKYRVSTGFNRYKKTGKESLNRILLYKKFVL